jgi:hypothetical protein
MPHEKRDGNDPLELNAQAEEWTLKIQFIALPEPKKDHQVFEWGSAGG